VSLWKCFGDQRFSCTNSCFVNSVCFHNTLSGGSRNFGKGDRYGGEAANRAPKARGPAGGLLTNFIKIDAISCNLAYIFGIRMASDIIQNWACVEQKTVAAKISIHTHTRIHPLHFQNSSDFSHYKIQIQFQTYFFRHCIQCRKKLTLPKIGGGLKPTLCVRENYEQSITYQ